MLSLNFSIATDFFIGILAKTSEMESKFAKMEIFQSSRNETENLAEILLRLEEICFPLENWNFRLIHSHLERHSSILARDAETILGYCLFSETSSELEIYRLGVLPTFRNQGVGRFLLNAVFLLAGNRDIYLEVDDTNFQAIRFYEKYGFQLLDKRKTYYQNGNDALLYVRRSANFKNDDC